MTNKKLTKVVYGYEIYQDKIVARLYYDNDHETIQRYTHNEWQEKLYQLRQMDPQPELKTVVEEYLNDGSPKTVTL